MSELKKHLEMYGTAFVVRGEVVDPKDVVIHKRCGETHSFSQSNIESQLSTERKKVSKLVEALDFLIKNDSINDSSIDKEMKSLIAEIKGE